LLHTPLKRARLPITPPQQFKTEKIYLLAGAFVFAAGAEFVELLAAASENEFVAGVSTSAPFEFSGTIFVFAGCVCCSATGCSAGASAGASPAALSTETFPLSAGIDMINAESMNTTAAAIVSFESTDAVPRGPNAALETLLVNNAPASVLPGCKSTAATSTAHEIKKIVYKTYSKLLTYL
jgi:hypothetical protein